MAEIKVSLSVGSIDTAIKNLDKIKRNIPKTVDDNLKRIAEDTKKKAELLYNSLQYKSVDSDVSFSVEPTEKGYAVIASGRSVLYDEFGTGTEGENEYHPLHDEFGMNPYNSGETIRSVSESVSEKTGLPTGELYWTFKDASGNIHYTQGVPSGKFMYQASEYLREKYKTDIVKKLGDEVSKV